MNRAVPPLPENAIWKMKRWCLLPDSCVRRLSPARCDVGWRKRHTLICPARNAN